jgi:hypothetical protein
MSDPSAALEFPWWMKAWFPSSSPTGADFVQPILPGWTVGGIVVNEQNSSAPETEREIVAADSYGRQIGQLMDAVAALIDEQGGAGDNTAYRTLVALKAKIDRAKVAAAAHRLDQVWRDLALLKTSDPVAYAAQVSALREMLG